VDLAGSERIKKTKAEGVRMKEGRSDLKLYWLIQEFTSTVCQTIYANSRSFRRVARSWKRYQRSRRQKAKKEAYSLPRLQVDTDFTRLPRRKFQDINDCMRQPSKHFNGRNFKRVCLTIHWCILTFKRRHSCMLTELAR
jgi:hypothetical protein